MGASWFESRSTYRIVARLEASNDVTNLLSMVLENLPSTNLWSWVILQDARGAQKKYELLVNLSAEVSSCALGTASSTILFHLISL